MDNASRTLGTTPRTATVTRRDLLAKLRLGATVPVVTVHAAAGFGKSTLARQWASDDARPHVTVHLTAACNDPAALAGAVIEALGSLGPDARRVQAVATSTEPGFSALLLPAIGTLASSRGRDYVLVLDDVHLVDNLACQAVLEALVSGVPAGSQVAFVGRYAPWPWLARLHVEGRLLCFGPDDLAFDEDESTRLIEQLGIDPSDPAAAELVARSDGWPVALYLMALAATNDQTDSHRGADDHTPGAPFVQDYLMCEVLGGLDPTTRDFLRRTSILEDLSASLCDAVLERRDSAAILASLAAHLQLVVSIDPHELRYRYHHLLVDALQADLQAHEPWMAPQLHHRSAQWFEAHGDLDLAVRHAKASGDLDLTGRIVWSGLPACIASGHPDRLTTWLVDLDDAAIRSDRWLCLAAAWRGLQSGDPDAMTRWLLAAEEHAGTRWEARAASDQYAASLACLHVVVGDRSLDECLELSRGAEQGLPRDSAFRAAALLNQGVAHTLLRRFREGADSLQRAELLGRALGVPIIEANALTWRGMLAVLTDDWAAGTPLIERAGVLVETHHLERLATSVTTITAVALLRAARGDKEEARLLLATSRRLTTRVSQIAPWFAVAGPLIQARAAILLGEPALARTLCTEAKAHLDVKLEATLLVDLLADTEARLRTFQDDQLFQQTLTASQMRVLQFLPSRLTFDQIGEHLFLSRATIKSHAAAIYRKLGATSRDEAVARARTLGLVEAPPTD